MAGDVGDLHVATSMLLQQADLLALIGRGLGLPRETFVCGVSEPKPQPDGQVFFILYVARVPPGSCFERGEDNIPVWVEVARERPGGAVVDVDLTGEPPKATPATAPLA